MPAVRLLLCGPLCLVGTDGRVVPGLGTKAQAMLAYLALQPDRQARREHLASLLWDGAEARHALRQTLLVLRRRLGEDAGRAIGTDAATVRLGPGVETDLADFESHLAAGRIEAACALRRGPFCAGLGAAGEGFEAWLAIERARLDECAAGGFGQLARQAEAEGRIEVATAAAQRLVALNALDDAAQATLIALYRRRGWTGAARLAHRRCVSVFHRERFGIAPGAEVQAAARAPVGLPPVPLQPRSPAQAEAQGWRRWAAAGVLMLAAGLAWQGRVAAPERAEAAPVAWVEASEWRANARPDSGGVPLAEAIARGLAGDPEFAHLVPGGC